MDVEFGVYGDDEQPTRHGLGGLQGAGERHRFRRYPVAGIMAQAHRCPDHGVVMRLGAHRRWISALGVVGAGVLIGSGTVVMSAPATSAAAESEATSPADLLEPTQKQLNNSVQRWEPGNVMEWNTADSVTPLATNKKEGSDAVITLASDILFDFDSAEISDKAEKAIAKTVEKVPDGTKVTVSGYTDSVG